MAALLPSQRYEVCRAVVPDRLTATKSPLSRAGSERSSGCEMLLSKLERGGASLALLERNGEAAARSARMAACVPGDPDRTSDRRQEQGDEDGHQRSNERLTIVAMSAHRSS
jgi:hypothetical protein